MSDLLITLGRALVAWCALLFVVAGFIGGFHLFGNLFDIMIFGPDITLQAPAAVTPGRLLAGAIGAFVACLLSASTLGLAAAVFDIQRNLRLLTEATVDFPASAHEHERAPTIARREPRLT